MLDASRQYIKNEMRMSPLTEQLRDFPGLHDILASYKSTQVTMLSYLLVPKQPNLGKHTFSPWQFIN